MNVTLWENSTNLVNPYFTWKITNKQSLVETIFYAEDFSDAPWYYNSFTVSVYNPLPPDELDVVVTIEDSCDHAIMVTFNGTSFPESYSYQSVGTYNGRPYYILTNYGGYYLYYEPNELIYPIWAVREDLGGSGILYAYTEDTGNYCPYYNQFDFVNFLWDGVTDLGVFVNSNNTLLPTYVAGEENGVNYFQGEISGPDEYLKVYYNGVDAWNLDYTNSGNTVNVATLGDNTYPPVNSSWNLSGTIPGLTNVATSWNPAPGPKEGWINIQPGEYTYVIYQMNTPADLDLNNVVKEVETGILVLAATFSQNEIYKQSSGTVSVYQNMDRI